VRRCVRAKPDNSECDAVYYYILADGSVYCSLRYMCNRLGRRFGVHGGSWGIGVMEGIYCGFHR
jgi:hypothetical protein